MTLNFILVIQCLWYLCIHKYYVWYFGTILNVPLWRILIHDLSKFHPTELQGYVRYHELKQLKSEDFYRAIHHHFRCNDHHWNYWTMHLDVNNPSEPYSVICIPMPDVAIREMVADWAAAGYGKNGYLDLARYYESQKDFILLHAKTRDRIEYYIQKLVDDSRIKRLQQTIPRTS